MSVNNEKVSSRGYEKEDCLDDWLIDKGLIQAPNNETRFEQVGDQQVKFERMGDTWRVSSHEIHRVFKGHTTTNHGAMINDMKRVHGDNWDAYLGLMNIHKT